MPSSVSKQFTSVLPNAVDPVDNTADAFARFVVRDPVKIDHAVSVRLKDGREVDIVTRSDFSILLPIVQ